MVNPPPTASAEDRPEPEASPNVSPEPATSKPAPKPKPSKSPTRKTLARAESAELVPPPKPVVPVVGLSFESTVTGGSGPGFAVGDTRMGQTAATASRSPSPDAPRSAGFNERATVRPGAGGNLVLPGRLREVDPDYPADLRALGIEANVVVRVDIDRLGAVTAVRLVKRAKDDAFNRAAREAAFRERFSPATVDGSATAYRLSFTYRFRLDG
ncbi:MAG: energy transducer TonB [Myxococcota bacterium]